MNTLRGETTLKINKKNVKVVINMNAFRILTQKFGVKLAELDTFMADDGIESICAITYCGALNAAARQNKEFEYNYDSFCAHFLDDETGMSKVADLITESFGPKEEGNA